MALGSFFLKVLHPSFHFMSSLTAHVNTVQQLLPFKQQNLCYSPFSLFYSLTILTECSDDASIQQLCDKLKLNKEQMQKLIKTLQKSQSINCAANIFTKNLKGVQEAFKNKMESQYGFVPEKLISVQQVNKWCSDHTNGKINEIIQDDNLDTLIISAIHFMDDWKEPFDEIPNYPDKFTTFDGQKIDKKMIEMNRRALYIETEEFQAVKQLYKNSPLTAVILLPKKSGVNGFNVNFNNVVNGLVVKVNLIMPEFKIESNLQLKETLKKLQIDKIFNRIDCLETLSDFMKVEEIVQKTYIKVDKKGTEAAAVTGLIMTTMCFIQQEEEVKLIKCDRPFWFLLMHENDVVFATSVIQ